MNVNTLSECKKRTVLHVTVVLVLLAAMMLIMSEHTFAAAAPQASAQVNARGGLYLRKSSTTGSRKLALLPDNTNITIYREIYKSKKSTAKKYVWYYVYANGKKGYVRSDYVDNIRYSMYSGTVKSKVAYRVGPGTKMKNRGYLSKGTPVVIYMDARPVSSTRGSSKIWYRIYYNGSFSFVCSSKISVGSPVSAAPAASTQAKPSSSGSSSSSVTSQTTTPATVQQVVSATSNAINTLSAAQFENYISRQGFPETYKPALRALHAKHPNWVFVGYNTGLKWNDVLKKQTAKNVSLVYKSYPSSYRSSSFKGQAEPGWYNARDTVVAYYLDPRNFLNEDRIYMFEDLAFQGEYQTTGVVNKIIGSTKLPGYGFTADVFMNAGRTYKISPVFLAARVVQETGGNSVSVNGYKYKGKVVYNPFNIGAYGGSNPVMNGLKYAYDKNWNTPASSVNGGASYLASGYINKKQNTIYFQRFNVCNGLSNAGTHQYMTNIMAPYSEAYITKNSYAKLGITSESLGFVIPIYTSMPASTRLP